jgi:hypothetical protein
MLFAKCSPSIWLYHPFSSPRNSLIILHHLFLHFRETEYMVNYSHSHMLPQFSTSSIIRYDSNFGRSNCSTCIRLHHFKMTAYVPSDRDQTNRSSIIYPCHIEHGMTFSNSKQCWNLLPDTTLVNISAGFSSVCTFIREISPFSTTSRIK